MDGGRPGGGGGRGGRLRTAALVGGRCAVRFLGSDSLRACAVGRLRASSGSEAAGPEAAASWAACVSLAARQSTRGPLPASRLSPAPSPSGRLAAVRRSRRRYRLAQKPVRDPGGGHSLSCSGLSRRPLPRSHPPSAAGGRRSLCFAQRRRRVRQQDASRVFPATRMRWRRALRDCGHAHTAYCVRVCCLIARPLGRDWVCV